MHASSVRTAQLRTGPGLVLSRALTCSRAPAVSATTAHTLHMLSCSWVCPQDSGAPLETVGREQPACLGANSECACEINTHARARARPRRATHTQSHTAHRGAETRCTSSLHHESRTAEQPAVAARARDMCICEHAHQSCFPRARRTMHAQLAHLICSTSISARYGTTVRTESRGRGCMCCGGLISLCTSPRTKVEAAVGRDAPRREAVGAVALIGRDRQLAHLADLHA